MSLGPILDIKMWVTILYLTRNVCMWLRVICHVQGKLNESIVAGRQVGSGYDRIRAIRFDRHVQRNRTRVTQNVHFNNTFADRATDIEDDVKTLVEINL